VQRKNKWRHAKSLLLNWSVSAVHTHGFRAMNPRNLNTAPNVRVRIGISLDGQALEVHYELTLQTQYDR